MGNKRKKNQLFIIALLFSANSLLGMEPIVLTEDNGEYSLGLYFEILEDKEGKLTLEDVQKPEMEYLWFKNKTEVPSFGFSKSVYWVRFKIHSQLTKDYLLEIAHPLLDRIDFYQVGNPNQIVSKTTGDLTLFNTRDIDYKNFVFLIPVSNSQDNIYLLRIESESSIQLPLTLWSPIKFSEKKTREMYILGLFFGILMVMALYNFFLWISIRDKSYIYYVCYIIFSAFFYANYIGISYQYFWSRSPDFYNASLPISLFLVFYFGINFTVSFLNLKEKSPFLSRILFIAKYIFLALSIFSFFLNHRFAILVAVLSGMLSATLILLAGILTFKKNYRPAFYYLVAWTTFLIGVIVLGFLSLGLLPKNFITQYSTLIGSALEMLLLSLGLADKINDLKKQNELSRIKNQEELEKINSELENKVNARTTELEAEKQKSVSRMNEYEKYNKALSSLTKSRAINVGNLEKALDEITELSSQVLEVERASVWKYNKKKKLIYCLNLFERSKGTHSRGIEFFEKDFPAYFQHLYEERTLAASDAHNSPATSAFSKYYSELNIHSILDVPIWNSGNVVGLLSFENTEHKRYWTIDEENFSTSISSLISTALESEEKNQARLKEIVARAEIEIANQMTIELIESPSLDESLSVIFKHLMGKYEIDILFFSFIDEAANKIIPYKVEGNNISQNQLDYIKNNQINLSEKNTLFSFAFKRNKNTYIQKVKLEHVMNELEKKIASYLNLKSILYIPIRVGQKNIGLLNIFNVTRQLTLTSEELDSISRLSFQVAGVIQKGKILQEAEKAKREAEESRAEIERIAEAMKLVNESENLLYVVQAMIIYLESEFNFDTTWLLLVDQNINSLFTYAIVSDLSPENTFYFKKLKIPLQKESGSLYFTYSRKKMLYLTKIPKQISGFDKEIVERLKANFFIQVPLVIHDKTIGILNLTSTKDMIRLSKSDLSKLQLFSDQIAGAVYNSYLSEKTQKAKEQAEIEKGIALMAQKEAEEERKKSDKLLLNILPQEVAEELKEKGSVEPVYFENATIMFTDFKGFTQIAEGLTPQELIKELDGCFSQFDQITERFNLEKLKTIGDAYMCAGGIPRINKTHAIDSCLAALEIQSFMNQMKELKQMIEKPYWELRLGIHSGSLMAGVVGEKKFAYDVWGDTVNTASRMESSGTPGKINISHATYELVQDYFDCEYRGEIDAKNKGKIKMYYLARIKKEYAKDKNGLVPNGAFWTKITKIG